MTRGTKRVAWAVGLLAGAAGIGGLTYFLMKPKEKVVAPPPNLPPPGGGGTKPTTITPTASPGIFAAFSPNSNVSWVDENGNPIGQGQNVNNAAATSRLPR